MCEANESGLPQPGVGPEFVGVARPVSWDAVRAYPVDAMLLETMSRSGALIDIALFLLAVTVALGVELGLYFLIPLALGIPAPAPDSDPSPELVRAVMLPAMAVRTLILTAAILIICRARRLALSSLGIGFRRFWSDAGIGVMLIMVLSLLMLTGLFVLQFVWPALVKQMQENAELLKDMVPRMNPAAILVLMVLVAWWEELVFRGFLLTRVRRAAGSWTAAVIVSGGVFTALHLLEQTGAALLAISLLALAFSLVTIWRRSLVPAMVAHLLFNLSQFFILYYVQFPAGGEV